jgi:hypothetical protein
MSNLVLTGCVVLCCVPCCAAVRREIKILRLFMHPHIIRLYEVIETSTDIYVVMEYVKGECNGGRVGFRVSREGGGGQGFGGVSGGDEGFVSY